MTSADIARFSMIGILAVAAIVLTVLLAIKKNR
jgi:hypothetical protein